MLGRLWSHLSHRIPPKYTWLTKYQALASTDVKWQISSLSQLSFLGKEGQNGRQHKTNKKVSLSRLFMQALDGHKVASNSQNRMVNTLVRHQRNRNKKVQALPPKQTKQEQKTKPVPVRNRYLSALLNGLSWVGRKRWAARQTSWVPIHLHLFPRK